MADFDDFKKVMYASRKISGSIYLAYREEQRKRGRQSEQSRAERARKKHIKKMRRHVIGRIGPMAALPFLTIAPLVISILQRDLIGIGAVALAMIAFFYGLYELRLALKLEADEVEAEARSAPAPKGSDAPHKLAGLACIAGGMAAFSLAGNPHILTALGFGGLASMGALWAVGPKGLWQATDPQQTAPKLEKSLAETPLGAALVKAGETLHLLYENAAKINNDDLSAQVRGVHAAAQDVVDELHEDTSDLPKARRFLATYLDGAAQVVDAYVTQARRGTSPALDDKFSNTLVTFERTFVAQLAKLRSNDELDLDVQMDVLDRQMKSEGVL